MNVLVVGGGGREHTLVWKIGQSPLVKKVYCTPGNPGIAKDAACEKISADDLDGLLSFAKKKKIDLTVVGPEAPLVAGIVDLFEKNGLRIFGPSKTAAALEGSKVFAKNIMKKYEIPTADFKVFDDAEKAKIYLKDAAMPIVLKADGLAAGKGVLVCEDRNSAYNALAQIMEQRAFGAAGDKIVVEACLSGQEVSLLALSDGESLVYMIPSQDHKRILDGDQGLNTGGMGAYAPTPFIDEPTMLQIKSEIMEPMIKAMQAEGCPYRGVLYAGLMLTERGPKVLEFNCRFGDPETQVVLPLSQSDLVEAIIAADEGRLDQIEWKNISLAAVCVVIASGGYPEKYEKGKLILGLDGPGEKDVHIFHAGTGLENGRIVTSGGRVLGVTAIALDIAGAKNKVYESVRKITFDGAYYRNDIAAKALGAWR